jgi:hypothetical protein
MKKRYHCKPFGDRPFGTVPCSRRRGEITWAAEISLGAASPSEIDVVAANSESQNYQERVVKI